MVILSSKGFTNTDILKHIKQSDSVIRTACVITTAAIPLKENGPNTKIAYQYIKDNITASVDFIDLEKDSPILLYNYDFIYITGGNSYHLFSVLQHTKSDLIIKEIIGNNKFVMGSSAGAMFLSSGNKYNYVFNSILNINEKSDLPFDNNGIGATRHILIPHYDRFLKQYPDLENRISEIEKSDGVHITRLNDSGYIIVKNTGEIIENLA